MSRSSGSNGAAWRALSGAERGAIRAELFRTKGTRCLVALPKVCTGRAEHAHHTGDWRVVSVRDMRFIVPACKACNLAVGDPGKGDPEPRPSRTNWGDDG